MKSFLAIVLCALMPTQAWSWGALGHKAAARIAWAYLDQQTQNEVTTILNGGNIADAAMWADAARAKPEWKFTIWYHFEKAPDNYTYLDNLKRQDDKHRKLGGLIEALYIAEDTLKDPNATRIDQENALKFAIHFIGDIHQPLHTGRVEDNSGNKIPIKWLGFDTNLHSVWDSQMIYLAYKNQFVNTAADHSQVYADILLNKFKDIMPTPGLFVRYDDWMHESMVPRADAYTYKDESEQAYTNRFIDIVDKRIFMAGLRIAFAIKRYTSNKAVTEYADPIETLRKAIVNIVGDFTEFVSLKPKFNLEPPITNGYRGSNRYTN